MGKINRQRWGMAPRRDDSERRDPLTVETMGGVDYAVLTVQDVNPDILVQGRPRGVIVFEEMSDFNFWFNTFDMRKLVEKLGDDTDEWVGQLVPIEKVRVENPRTHEMVDKYAVAEPFEWGALIAEHKTRQAPPARTKVARKRATKKSVRKKSTRKK